MLCISWLQKKINLKHNKIFLFVLNKVFVAARKHNMKTNKNIEQNERNIVNFWFYRTSILAGPINKPPLLFICRQNFDVDFWKPIL